MSFRDRLLVAAVVIFADVSLVQVGEMWRGRRVGKYLNEVNLCAGKWSVAVNDALDTRSCEVMLDVWKLDALREEFAAVEPDPLAEEYYRDVVLAMDAAAEFYVAFAAKAPVEEIDAKRARVSELTAAAARESEALTDRFGVWMRIEPINPRWDPDTGLDM